MLERRQPARQVPAACWLLHALPLCVPPCRSGGAQRLPQSCPACQGELAVWGSAAGETSASSCCPHHPSARCSSLCAPCPPLPFSSGPHGKRRCGKTCSKDFSAAARGRPQAAPWPGPRTRTRSQKGGSGSSQATGGGAECQGSTGRPPGAGRLVRQCRRWRQRRSAQAQHGTRPHPQPPRAAAGAVGCGLQSALQLRSCQHPARPHISRLHPPALAPLPAAVPRRRRLPHVSLPLCALTRGAG